jgi:hypothetical protein
VGISAYANGVIDLMLFEAEESISEVPHGQAIAETPWGTTG